MRKSPVGAASGDFLLRAGRSCRFIACQVVLLKLATFLWNINLF